MGLTGHGSLANKSIQLRPMRGWNSDWQFDEILKAILQGSEAQSIKTRNRKPLPNCNSKSVTSPLLTDYAVLRLHNSRTGASLPRVLGKSEAAPPSLRDNPATVGVVTSGEDRSLSIAGLAFGPGASNSGHLGQRPRRRRSQRRPLEALAATFAVSLPGGGLFGAQS
jgi:hypothetical protein